MSTFELMNLQSAVEELRKTLPGSTPDLRTDAIVKSIEAIERWIAAFERRLPELGSD